MASAVIAQEDAEDFLTQILSNEFTCIDECSAEPWRGGTRLEISLGQVDRDVNDIFCIDGRAGSIDTGGEDDGTTSAFHCDLVTEEGLRVVGAGWFSQPEYNDDEYDCSLSLTLYVCAKADLKEARTLAGAQFRGMICGAIDAHLDRAIALFKHAGDQLPSRLAASATARRIMRVMASGV